MGSVTPSLWEKVTQAMLAFVDARSASEMKHSQVTSPSQDQSPELELVVPPSQHQIAEAILEFLAAETWTEKIQIVENYWNLLLTDDADAILANSLFRNDEAVARLPRSAS